MNVRMLLPGLVAGLIACGPPKNLEAKSEVQEAKPAVAAAPEPIVPPTLRLPDTVRPLRYDLELAVDPSKDTFDGAIEIDLKIDKPTTVLWLNATELTMQAAILVVNGTQVPLTPVDVKSEHFIGFQFPQPVSGHAKFRANYQGKISSKESAGVFKQKEGDDWYVFTHFEPTDARRAFPGFDEPSYKVPFQVVLNVPENLVAVSNQPMEKESSAWKGFKRVQFTNSRPMPTYLVAFAVGPFDILDGGTVASTKRPMRILTPKGRKAEAQYAAEVTAELTGRLERYFGLAFPYEKLDTVAVPMFYGAMENPGLITFSMNALLAKPEEDSLGRQRRMAEVQAHELAHMWFGDMVTIAWWDDTWLKESFADWAAGKVVQAWQPKWQKDVSLAVTRNQAMVADSLVAAKAIRQPIASEGDILNAFDFDITYKKGEGVLTMLEAYVGEDKFRAGIKDYLKTNAWKTATNEDFLKAISAAAGQDVGPVFASFIDHAGVPLVKVDIDCSATNPKLTVEQSRYVPVGSKGVAQQTWQIPFCVRYGVGEDSARECTLLTQPKTEFTLQQVEGCPDWVYANDQQNGYYRTALSPKLLRDLMAPKKSPLTVAEQVGLLNDLSAGVQSGDVAAAEVLRHVSRAAQSDNRHVLVAAVNVVEDLKYDLVPANVQANYQRFVKKTFGARAKKLGLSPGKKDTEDVRLLRPSLVALAADAGNEQALLSDAKKLAEKWLKDRRSVSPDMVEVVLQLAGRHADASLHTKLLNAAKATSDRRERLALLSAIGAAKDPALTQKNLKLLGESDFDPRESYMLLWGALGDRKTRDLAYDHVKNGWDTMAQKLPKQSLPYVISIVGAFCDKGHRADAEQFFSPKAAELPGADRMLAKALEQVDLCIARKEKQSASVAEFLRAY